MATNEYLLQLVPFARQVSETAQDLYENPPVLLIASFDPGCVYDEFGLEKPTEATAQPAEAAIHDFRAQALATKLLADRMVYWGEESVSVEERVRNSMSILNAFASAVEKLKWYTRASAKTELL